MGCWCLSYCCSLELGELGRDFWVKFVFRIFFVVCEGMDRGIRIMCVGWNFLAGGGERGKVRLGWVIVGLDFFFVYFWGGGDDEFFAMLVIVFRRLGRERESGEGR